MKESTGKLNFILPSRYHNSFYTLINSIFLVPVIGSTLLPIINYGYFPPILFILILKIKHKRLKVLGLTRIIQSESKNICFLLFYLWCSISILFIILFYDQKLANIANIGSILVIHVMVMRYLRFPDAWAIFIENMCWFVFYFLMFNLVIQLLPVPLGQFIFEKASGFDGDTTGFAYTSVFDSIKSFPSQVPLSLPTYRNHGVAFFATIGISACTTLLNLTKVNKSTKNKITIALFFYSVLMFFCYSRTSLITVAVILFSMAIRSKHKFLFIALGLLILMSSSQLVSNFIIEVLRIDTSDFEKTGAGRELIVELHQKMIYMKPLTGWGWVLPYEDFNYDITKNPFSESGLTFVLATQGLIRGSLYIALLVAAVVRNFILAKQSYHHNFIYFITVQLLATFLFQGGLTGVSSSVSTISHVLLAIALYSEPISNQQSSSSLDTI